MVYGNAHRCLLRTIASQGVTSYENCTNIFKRLPDFAGTEIETVIKDINKEIQPFKQKIKIVIDELTLERKVVFLSTGNDDATKSQNVFSPKELDYFRILIENIMTTVNREIDIHAALRLTSQVKPILKKTDAEIILQTWCTLHYLDINNNCYALGVRAIHEFESYLLENMPDTVRNCSVCEKNVFRGVNCPACDKSIHTLCLNVSLERVKKWPCCKVVYGNSQTRQSQTQRSSLPPTQLLQTQTYQGNSSNEPMDVSDSDDETDVLKTPVRSRKRRRLSSN